MKRLYITLFCGIIVLSAHQCNDDGLSRSISFYNSSGKPVYCYEQRAYGIFYPDTILPESNKHLIKIDKEAHFSFGGRGYHEDHFFANLPGDTLSVFFLDPDTLARYDWAIIRRDYKILVRYDLSHNDLKKLNWCIYYPPTEAMKDMKMYPPYKK